MAICEECKARFVGSESDDDLALSLSVQFPNGVCEQCSVGENTIGPVSNEEMLYRIYVDPRDFDEGQIAEAPFRSAFKNGLSVLRSTASHQDCLDQTQEGMYRKLPEDQPRLVKLIGVVGTSELRAQTNDRGRSFFVYDQTAPRQFTEGPPITGHAGVFCLVLPKGTEDRRTFERDLAGALKKLFSAKTEQAGGFLNGLLLQLNTRSADGEFTLPQGED